MDKGERTGKIIFFIIFLMAIGMVCFVVKNKTTTTDIVIKTDTEEFVVDDYEIDMDKECVYFTYDGHVRTICGNYEIIE